METHHHRAALDHATRAHSEALHEYLRASEGAVSKLALDMARATVYADLELCDDLGFDSRAEALSTILAHNDWTTRWDCRDCPALIEDVERYKALRLAARLTGTL